jgi:2-C-methyl-D-erythritol 4-phosphate cytidylyltransferase
LNTEVIIVAGGTGTRMHETLPKQFLLLGNRPILFYSLEAFYAHNPKTKIVLVLPTRYIEMWQALCEQYDFTIPHLVVAGGETRFHSVKNALAHLHDDTFVAIHDGARPLVTNNLIERTFRIAFEKGNCIPALSISESLRIVENNQSKPVDRKDYRIIQTPQVFRTTELRKAYTLSYNALFTDDATVFEWLKKPIHLCEGDPLNIKITLPADLAYAEFIRSQHP